MSGEAACLAEILQLSVGLARPAGRYSDSKAQVCRSLGEMAGVWRRTVKIEAKESKGELFTFTFTFTRL